MPDTANSGTPVTLLRRAETLTRRQPKEAAIPCTPAQHSNPAANDWSYATEELLDAMPPPWTRGLLYLLVAFVAISLPWTMLAKVDETGKARGRVEPLERTLKIDSSVSATVAKVMVKEGQTVTTQQGLLELEAEPLRSELQRVRIRLEGQRNRLAQLKLLDGQMVLGTATQQERTQAQTLEKQAQVEQAQQDLEALKATYTLHKKEKQVQLEQAGLDVDHHQTQFELADIRLTRARREVERYQGLFRRGLIVRIVLAEKEDAAEERLILWNQAQSALDRARLHLQEQENSLQTLLHNATADIRQAKLRLEEQKRSYQGIFHSGELTLLKSQEERKNLQAQILSLKAEIAESEALIQDLQSQLDKRIITAPAAGTIFQLTIQQPGAVVQPGEMIAEIAPQGSSLVLRAQIATHDSGSLEPDMPVKIKFDAYPFQDYGIVPGKLLRISPTSRLSETNRGPIATYDLDIALHNHCISTPAKCISLRPGDTATAEIIVRQRRIIDLLLDPFKRLRKDGLDL